MLATALCIMPVFSVSQNLCDNSFSSVWRPVLLLYVFAIACSVDDIHRIFVVYVFLHFVRFISPCSNCIFGSNPKLSLAF
jgi:hypothetical protein